MPPLLVEIEEHFGVDALHDFLRRHAGGTIWLQADPDRAAPGTVEAFLSERLGGGYLKIPFGPLSFPFRRRVALLRALQDGASVRNASLITGYSQRNVYAVKAEFRARGLLPKTLPKGTNP